MEIARFAARYPRLYHATFAENERSILEHGLLTPADILRRGGWPSDRIDLELSEPRPEPLEVEWFGGSRVTLRDQRPLRVGHLKRAFPHISATDYVRNLGRRVFFWCSDAKKTKVNGADYYGRAQIVLTFDTARLLEEQADRIELCRVNSGTLLMPAAIGSETNRNPSTMFSRIAECEWRLGDIKEVTLLGSLPSVAPYLAQN